MTTIFISLLVMYMVIGIFTFSRPPLGESLKEIYEELSTDFFYSEKLTQKLLGVFLFTIFSICIILLLFVFPIVLIKEKVKFGDLIKFKQEAKSYNTTSPQRTTSINCKSDRLDRDFLFRKFPVLETQNLILRNLQPSDIPQLYKLYIDEDITREFEFENPQLYDYDVTLKNITDGFKLKQSITWGMILKKENLLIGMRTCFIDGDDDPAVFEGMVLNSYRGKGFTTEAYIAIIKFLRQANVKAIKAKTKKYNKPAISMLEKFGFINVSNPSLFSYINNNTYVFEKDLTQENSLLLTDTKIADNLSVDTYYKLSLNYYKENQYALANYCIDKAIAKAENNSDFYYQRGLVILASIGRIKALPDFKKAIEINPNHINAMIESGNILYVLGNKSGGREYWNRAANLGSDRASKLLQNNPDWGAVT